MSNQPNDPENPPDADTPVEPPNAPNPTTTRVGPAPAPPTSRRARLTENCRPRRDRSLRPPRLVANTIGAMSSADPRRRHGGIRTRNTDTYPKVVDNS